MLFTMFVFDIFALTIVEKSAVAEGTGIKCGVDVAAKQVFQLTNCLIIVRESMPNAENTA